MKRIAIIAATLTLAACQTVPSGVTQADYEACDYEATKYTHSSDVSNLSMGGAMGAGIADGIRHMNLRNACLRQRGYR